MAKYSFKKPFSKQIAVGGVVGLGTYSKNIGDVVEGEIIQKESASPQIRVLINSTPIQGADMYVQIPLEYLAPYTNGQITTTSTGNNNVSTSNNTKSTEAKSFFTPKNVIIGLVVIGAIIGGLKLAKVF